MKTLPIMFLFILSLLLAACNLPDPNPTVESTAVISPAVEELPSETHTAIPETIPTALLAAEETPTEPAAAPLAEPNVVCNGISFYLENSLASNESCALVPANPGAADSPGFGVYPEHTEITLEGYHLHPLPETFHQPRILVYPVAEYEALNPAARDNIANLRQLLADQPADPESIPFLPMFGAAQMLHSKVFYTSFENGSGVRFITQYSQAAIPVNNAELFYTFQGITADNRYYVSVILPVSHPELPDSAQDVPDGNWEAFTNNFEDYLVETQAALDGYINGSFKPHLELLDQLIQHLRVE